jgi:hypothetical protein
LSTPEKIEIISDGYKLDAGIFMPLTKGDGQAVVIYCPGFPGSIKTSEKIARAFSERGITRFTLITGVLEAAKETSTLSHSLMISRQ